ncbi:MAG TPA: 50S ribosomal protein L23 [Burkholderiales bacterium]|jgi:large subunit ribosomal protein L23|nr:50S ribosomal protein L23 [Burkholderiales bacterium]
MSALNRERLMRIILAPQVSEKSTRLGDKHGQVVIRVLPDATKTEIKAAIEFLFSSKDKKVEVLSVQVANMRGKAKRFGSYTGRRNNWKKAYVCLKPGHDINFAAAENK